MISLCTAVIHSSVQLGQHCSSVTAGDALWTWIAAVGVLVMKMHCSCHLRCDNRDEGSSKLLESKSGIVHDGLQRKKEIEDEADERSDCSHV